MAKAKKPAFKKRSVINTDLYQRFLYVVQYSETNRDAARRLNISERTLRRWKRDGISQRASQSPERIKHIKHVSAAILGNQKRKHYIDRKELRPVFYYHLDSYTGARSKIWKTKGLKYDQLLEIVLRECYHGGYVGFSFLLEFTRPFEGFITGNSDFISLAEVQGLSRRNQKEIRDTTSFIMVKMDDPYISSRRLPLLPNDCHPDNFTDSLDKFYHMQDIEIVNIKFNEPRDKQSWYGDEEDEEQN